MVAILVFFIYQQIASFLNLARRTGVNFCVFQANRGESEASAKRKLRARGLAVKNPACPHTIVQALPPPDTP